MPSKSCKVNLLLATIIAGAVSWLAPNATHGESNTGKAVGQMSQSFEFPVVSPQSMGMNASKLDEARDNGLKGGGAGCVIWKGKKVYSWGDDTKYDIKSATKTFGMVAMGLAVKDGKASLDTLAYTLQPDIVKKTPGQPETAKKITLRHLLTQTAGFEKIRGYGKLEREPGSAYFYSDGGPNWLAECLTLAYGQDLDTLMYDRVFSKIGIKRSDYKWRENSMRDKTIGNGIPSREFGAGISINADGMAKFGYFLLNKGKVNGEQIISEDWIEMATHCAPELLKLYDTAPDLGSKSYGFLTWINDGKPYGLTNRFFRSAGLFSNCAIVIPEMDMVIARVGPQTMLGVPSYVDALVRPVLESTGKKLRPQAKSRKTAAADEEGTPKKSPGIQVYVDNVHYESGVAPVIAKDEILVLRRCIDGFGVEEKWSDGGDVLTLSRKDKSLQITVSRKEAIVNGEKRTIENPPVEVEGKRLYPIKLVCEAFGYDIKIDKEANRIDIHTPLTGR